MLRWYKLNGQVRIPIWLWTLIGLSSHFTFYFNDTLTNKNILISSLAHLLLAFPSIMDEP